MSSRKLKQYTRQLNGPFEEPYRATKDASYFHIENTVKIDYKTGGRSKTIAIKWEIPKETIWQDCWIDIWSALDCHGYREYHRDAYNGKIINTELEDRMLRQTTSVAVEYYLMDRLKKEKRRETSGKNKPRWYKLVTEEELNSAEFEEIVEQNSLNRMLTAISTYSRDEQTIFKWVSEILTDEEAMQILNVRSVATLYNRWKKLKEKIFDEYHSPDENLREDLSQHIIPVNAKPIIIGKPRQSILRPVPTEFLAREVDDRKAAILAKAKLDVENTMAEANAKLERLNDWLSDPEEPEPPYYIGLPQLPE